ncbi:MAG: L,D-transpeptidase family protein [Firmicutes bacterium]|nr:L,D-transpeptidase family protein [Bacillota bacterium]
MIKLFRIAAVLLCIIGLLVGYEQYAENNATREYTQWEALQASKSKKNPYRILVDVEEAKLYLLENGVLKKSYPCAGGKYTTPSPIGTWKIISKDTWGEGFGGRWMGFNVPWGKFGIHGTIYPNSIGWSSSKGCIRMFNKDVKDLYNIVPHGTRVTIVDGPFGPFGRGIRSLDPGEYGADVMEVQKKLKELGYYYGGIDGKYGEGMKAAVHKYQKDHKLPVGNKISTRMIEQLGFFEFE